MKLRKKSPILICVDIQMGFLEEEYWGGGRNNRDAEIICSAIIELCLIGNHPYQT